MILSRLITRPLIDGVNFAKAIAAGDLTQRIDPKHLRRSDEIGGLAVALQEMVDHLNELISGIKASVSSIGTASSEIAAGNSDLSQRTEEQASSLEETAASLEELTSTVRQNADNARQANQLSAAANEEAAAAAESLEEQVIALDKAVAEFRINNVASQAKQNKKPSPTQATQPKLAANKVKAPAPKPKPVEAPRKPGKPLPALKRQNDDEWEEF